jgi:hypothetical protein
VIKANVDRTGTAAVVHHYKTLIFLWGTLYQYQQSKTGLLILLRLSDMHPQTISDLRFPNSSLAEQGNASIEIFKESDVLGPFK